MVVVESVAVVLTGVLDVEVENVAVVLPLLVLVVGGDAVVGVVAEVGVEVGTVVMVVVGAIVVMVMVVGGVVAVVDDDGLMVVVRVVVEIAVVVVIGSVVVVVVSGVVVVGLNNGQHPKIPQSNVVLENSSKLPVSEKRSSPSSNWLIFAKIWNVSMTFSPCTA